MHFEIFFSRMLDKRKQLFGNSQFCDIPFMLYIHECPMIEAGVYN